MDPEASLEDKAGILLPYTTVQKKAACFHSWLFIKTALLVPGPHMSVGGCLALF